MAETNYLLNSFPTSYLNNYVINGTELLNASFDNLVFVETDVVCANGYRTCQSLTLQDLNKNNLDNTLNISTTGAYQLYLKSYYETLSPKPSNVLGTYQIDNGGGSLTTKASSL
jgi:hypothetical protein